MKKLSLRIDLTKIDKTKIVDRTYDKQDGTSVTEKNYKFELIPLKEEKIVKSADTYTLVKVAFLSEPSVKNPDGTKTNGTIIGDALEFRNIEEQPIPTGQGYKGTVGTGEVSDTTDIPW